jgi:hypothetical protein
LLKEGIGQRATPSLLVNPGCEVCVGTRVKPLKAQVLQHVLAVFQSGRFSFRHLNRQRRGQIELLPQIIDNVRGYLVDMVDEAAIQAYRTDLYGNIDTETLPIPCDLVVVPV